MDWQLRLSDIFIITRVDRLLEQNTCMEVYLEVV